ncbi:hypothetical protein [Paracoccus sp. KR1-242]|uniref:hypothetical protein n=1 Tax=Paracoccus sp. KR1-242 TaxID=3410028 RepID=UPI003C08EF65
MRRPLSMRATEIFAMHYQMTIRTFSKEGDPGEAWFVFGHDAPSLGALHEKLIADGCLLGRRYDTRPAGEGVRKVRRSIPVILSRDIVLQVTPLPDALRDTDGTVIHEACDV